MTQAPDLDEAERIARAARRDGNWVPVANEIRAYGARCAEAAARETERLRAMVGQLNGSAELQNLMRLNNELSARAEAAEARVKALEEALRPFADASTQGYWQCWGDEYGEKVAHTGGISLAMLKAARALLPKAGGGPPTNENGHSVSCQCEICS